VKFSKSKFETCLVLPGRTDETGEGKFLKWRMDLAPPRTFLLYTVYTRLDTFVCRSLIADELVRGIEGRFAFGNRRESRGVVNPSRASRALASV